MSKFKDPLSKHKALMATLADPLKDIRKSIKAMTNPLEEHRGLMESMADPLKEHRALMASMDDPLKEHRALMASMDDPLKEHRALMASMVDPLKEHHALMASMADPLKEYGALMPSMADPLKEHRALMASMTNPLKEHHALMASMANPLKEHRALMASMADPMKEFRASIAAISNSFKSLSDSILRDSSLRILKEVALEVGPELSFQEDGLIALSSKQITATELQDLSDQVIHSSSQIPSTSLEESINNLVEEIRSQKDPLTQKLLIWFIYPLIVAIVVSFINPVVDYHVKDYLNTDKRSLSKRLKQRVISSVTDENILSEFRYVSADVLNVRYSASQKSELIGRLRFGNAVILIEKQRSWTLVEWNDPDTDVQITGWVFSRYLAKFK